MKYGIYFLCIVGFLLLFLPEPASAQGIINNVCLEDGKFSGGACTSCDIIKVANSLIDWLIGIITVLFAVLMVYAGFELVVSQGNPSAMESAKKKLSNAIIGFIIVLAAWIVVDFIVRSLMGTEEETSGIAPWAQIECFGQNSVDQVPDYDYESITQSNQEVTTCSTEEECQELIDNCEGEASVDRSDPTQPSQVTCVTESAPNYFGNSTVVAYASQMDAQQCQYSQPDRNNCQGTPGYTDCSDLVFHAFKAAGCRSPGHNTAAMYPRATAIGDQSSLRAGDAIVYRYSCKQGTCGHVVICRENGCRTVIHAAGRNNRAPKDQIDVANSSSFLSRSGAKVLRVNDYCN